MSITFTENGVYGIRPGGFPNSVVTNAELANGTITTTNLARAAAGTILKVYHFNDATQSISTSAAYWSEPIQTSFTRLRTDTSILAIGHVPCAHQDSNMTGDYLRLDNTFKYEASIYRLPGGGDDGVRGFFSLNGLWRPNELAGRTTIQVGIGWRTGNNSTQRLSAIWNPCNRSARDREHTASIMFFELLDPATETTDDRSQINSAE